MKTLKNIWTWLVQSSEDPERVSTTVKGILVGVIPLIAIFTGGSETFLSGLPDMASQIIVAFFGSISAITALVGVIAKIKNTKQGKFDTQLGAWKR